MYLHYLNELLYAILILKKDHFINVKDGPKETNLNTIESLYV